MGVANVAPRVHPCLGSSLPEMIYVIPVQVQIILDEIYLDYSQNLVFGFYQTLVAPKFVKNSIVSEFNEIHLNN